ncbi:MAG: aldose 1-epimerase [Gammaproteobacteria bacterium]
MILVVTLTAGSTRLQVSPAAGRSITRYCPEHAGQVREWMWPARAADIAARNPLAMSSFPLVPFSGRIRAGRFTFQDRQVRLPLNFLPHPHVIHGHGWQQPWSVIESGSDGLTIEYRHAADDWPWAYRARQRFHLGPARLEVTASLVNESNAPMPAGIGLHPYFMRTPQARVTAPCERFWLNDEEVMPLALVDPPADGNFNQGVRMDSVFLDNTCTGWSGTALIEWPEWNASLVIEAEPPLSFLVVYAPIGGAFFCVEPVSNAADAFNLAREGRTDTGMTVLAPGAELIARVRFIPRL